MLGTVRLVSVWGRSLMGERHPCKMEDVGSTPTGSTNFRVGQLVSRWVWYNKYMSYYNHKTGCQCVFHVGRRNHKLGCQCVAHAGAHRSGRRFQPGNVPRCTRPLEEVLVQEGQKGRAQRVKLRLIKAGLLEDICSCCGSGPEWQGESLTLQLDHVNGNARDWRFENLRVLCPNCHSQTPTFCGANAKKSTPRC